MRNAGIRINPVGVRRRNTHSLCSTKLDFWDVHNNGIGARLSDQFRIYGLSGNAKEKEKIGGKKRRRGVERERKQ